MLATVKEEIKRNKEEKQGKTPQAPATQEEEVSPSMHQFVKTYQLAFEASILVRDQVLVDKKKEEAGENRDIDAFTMMFKDLFAKYFGEFRYRGDPRVVYCVLKAQGDILLELRSIAGAILTYKELVTAIHLINNFYRKITVRRRNCTRRRWQLTHSSATATVSSGIMESLLTISRKCSSSPGTRIIRRQRSRPTI